MTVLRRFLHGFFALAMLLGGFAAEPVLNLGAPVPHQDCCCGNEAACPCEPVRTPQGPRTPCGAQAQSLPALPAAAVRARLPRLEPRPWEGLRVAVPAQADASPPAARPRDLPRPPDRSLQRLSELSTFRI